MPDSLTSAFGCLPRWHGRDPDSDIAMRTATTNSAGLLRSALLGLRPYCRCRYRPRSPRRATALPFRDRHPDLLEPAHHSAPKRAASITIMPPTSGHDNTFYPAPAPSSSAQCAQTDRQAGEGRAPPRQQPACAIVRRPAEVDLTRPRPTAEAGRQRADTKPCPDQGSLPLPLGRRR